VTLRFDRNTTADEVVDSIDLDGKTFLITGASSGLGQEAARALASRGARVIIAVRSAARGEAAAQAIRAAHPDARLEIRAVDLGSLSSIRGFTDGLTKDHGALHGIIANAGIMATDAGVTSDGFEAQFGTNHLGHFLLVNRLTPLLRDGAPSRLVVMSSGAHRLHSVDLDDPNFKHKAYDRWDAYGQSKSANALFALAFDARHRADGVRAFTVAPGIISETNLHHHLTPEMFAPLRARQPGVSDLPRKSLAAGAATMVWALLDPELEGHGGDFLEDCGFSEINPDPRLPYGVIPWVRDRDLAEKVWSLSERLVGETFSR
jgi:NAD(P)-dependent dehydrogenase (short-subunit alcohol dehydrogenase family)